MEFCANSHFWEATTAKRMKIHPYYQRQKCSPVTSFQKYRPKVYADIRGGSCGRGRQMTVGLSTTVIFGDLGGYTSLETLEIRPAILHGDMLPLVGL